MLDLGLVLQACVLCVAVWHHWHQNDVLVQYMSPGTTIVAGSVSVVFPCMLIVLVVVVSVGPILICVCTLILVLSMVCELASVWSMTIQVTGHRGFQWLALVCYLHEPSVYLLICLGYVVLESNSVPVTLAILVVGHQGWRYERGCITIMSCVDYKQGVRCWS